MCKNHQFGFSLLFFMYNNLVFHIILHMIKYQLNYNDTSKYMERYRSWNAWYIMALTIS